MGRYQAEFVMQAPEGSEDVDILSRSPLVTDNLLSSRHGEELKVTKDRLFLSCDAPDKNKAYKWALSAAVRFTRLISMKTGQHFTPIFNGLDSVPGEPGQSILPPLPFRWWVDTYDPGGFPDDLAASGVACSLTDTLLDRALEYFQRGLFYRRVAWRLIHPSSPERNFTASEATLNFYKAVAVILGDDPHSTRSQALQLDKELRRRIEHLYKRRSDRDVAHPSLDLGTLDELVNTMAASQEIARKVIDTYVNLLREDRKSVV